MTEKEWRQEFSKRILKKMNHLGINQRELAKLTQISEITISRYISCERTPRADNIVNMAKVLQSSTAELIQFGEMVTK